jgi:hypothetical protein
MAAQCGVKGRNSKPALLLLKSRARRWLIVHKMHMAAVILNASTDGSDANAA